MPDHRNLEVAQIRENIKRLNDKLTLIFTGVGVVAGVKPDVFWPAIQTHWLITAICLLLGVAPIQEFARGNDKILNRIRWAKWGLLWAVVIVAFLIVIGKEHWLGISN